MAQEPSIEAARTRIQRLVDEIAGLSKKEMRSEEYFAQFLNRVVEACDAKGGAVWLVGKTEGKSEFQLAAQVEFESSLFQSDEQQRANLLKTLGEVIESKRPLVFAPAHAQADAGSLQAQLQQLQGSTPQPEGNKTPYPFLHVPLFLKEQVLGVVQVWLQPYVAAQNFAEFATFLTSLASYVEQHLQSRRLGTLVLETQRLQHLLKFTSDMAGSLDPLEVARLSTNYGRDLIGSERCSILTFDGDKWKVLSISGQEVVEKKSSMVKAMAAFVGAHARPELVLLSKKELLARAEGFQSAATPVNDQPDVKAVITRRTDEIDLAYFELSHVISAAIAPMLDDDKQLVGAYFAESTSENFFDAPPGAKELPPATRVTDWLATHSGRSLRAAQEYHSLPFLGITKRLRNTRMLLTGRKRNRSLLKLGVALAIIGAVCVYPKLDRVDGNCALVPLHRNTIVPEIAGRIEKVLVREGDHVKKGDIIAQLDIRRIETELMTNEQERLRLQADAERSNGLGDVAGAQVALLQARVTEQNAKKLQTDLEAATLRSPIDGVVITKDIELHAGEFIQPGVNFAEVASLDKWELQVDINEKEIGRVERAVPNAKSPAPRDVNFILYSQSAHQLHSSLTQREQISSAAYPREKENVFIVTLQNISIPADLQGAMRPGLTGRAKIDLGRRPLAWIAAERVWNWVQMRMIG
ncbi:MAG: hypothetical protein JWL90_3524 [Chthoniobacteraceae bacterium]|nr:hypothetical protein [Chthoniobacteraceae bacterium]